ncbi:MAG: hypothetical protein FJ296_10365 [Planctomycetes bacterium]|nr:hypothetical protein [Planctomycetota bacterium]
MSPWLPVIVGVSPVVGCLSTCKSSQPEDHRARAEAHVHRADAGDQDRAGLEAGQQHRDVAGRAGDGDVDVVAGRPQRLAEDEAVGGQAG